MKRKSVSILYLLAACLLSAVIIKADEPLPPPADYRISSQNGQYEAFFDVKNKITSVYKIEKNKNQRTQNKIWEMSGWFRNTFLSNDGENLVIVYDGANLLELDYQTDQIMISFYHRGQLLNEVRLNQLIENPVPENLEKTVSHYKWVSIYGLNEKQIFVVDTIGGKRFRFDIKNGLPIETKLYSADTFQNRDSQPGNFAANSQAAPDSNQRAKSCQSALLLIVGTFAGLINFRRG